VPASDRHVGSTTLTLLSLAGFAALAAMRLCDAMLPELARAFSTPTSDAAMSIASFALAYGAMQLVYGPLGDRFGKPRVIAYAAIACAVATVGAAAAPSLQALVVARAAMGGAAAAIVPLALAWIGDHVSWEQRQAVLARYNGATISGIMVGTVAGGAVTDLVGWRLTFLILVPLFAVTAVFLLRESRRNAHAQQVERPPYWRQVKELLQVQWARRVLVAVFLEGMLVFSCLAFVPTVLDTRFGLSLTQGGFILAMFALGGLVFSRAAGPLLRRFTQPVLARIGGGLLTTGFVLLSILPHWSWAAIGCCVAGFGFYMFHSNLQFSATQLSTSSRGVAVSLFACSLWFGQSVGVSVAALAFARLPAAACFGTAASALALLCYVFANQLRGQPSPLPWEDRQESPAGCRSSWTARQMQSKQT